MLAVAAMILLYLFVQGRQAGNSPVLTALVVSSKSVPIVEITGDVEQPGVYPVSDKILTDSVIQMAIPRCGGRFIWSDNGWNHLGPFGKNIYIECKTNNNSVLARVAPLSAAHSLTLGLPLDLNRASATELELIPGIGPRLAENIVQYRQKNGGFGALNELQQVEGIGEVKLKQLVGYFNIP